MESMHCMQCRDRNIFTFEREPERLPEGVQLLAVIAENVLDIEDDPLLDLVEFFAVGQEDVVVHHVVDDIRPDIVPGQWTGTVHDTLHCTT